MFPLSTPTSAGLVIDWLSLIIVLAGVCAFIAGLDDVWRRAQRAMAGHTQRAGMAETRAPLLALELGAYGVLALVGLAVLVMLAGGRGIPVAQAAFLPIAGWGLVVLARRAKQPWRWFTSASGDEILRAAAFVAAGIWSIWFWSDLFRDHVALPVMHDGIAHTTYYLRILEAGVPTLGRVPIGFADLFGTQTFDFYPTGTHAMMAVTSGFWGQWGIVSHAGILKCWFTLAAAGAPWALYWVARRLMPRMPWGIGLAVIFVAMPGFRYPLEAIHEGGASRLLAHLVMAPIYADVILGRFAHWRRQPLAAILLGVAFVMHPSAFVTLAALLGYASICAAVSDAGWRPRVVRLAAVGGALAIAGVIAMGLVRWNGGAVVPRDSARSFSWLALASRLAGGGTTFFDADYGMGAVKGALIGVGLVALVARRRAFGLRWRVVALPFWMVLVAALALTAQMIALPGFRLIGAAFYDETPRVIELLYEVTGLCLAGVAWLGCSLVAGRHPSVGRRTAAAVATVIIIVAALTHQVFSAAWVRDHIRNWDLKNATSRISRLQPLGRWIMDNTEPNAVVFHLPFDAEIWEAWTGRRGTFMYGECHANNAKLPCMRREQLVASRIGVLGTLLAQDPATGRCLAPVDRFRRPAYFLVFTPVVRSTVTPLCSDATYVTSLSGRAVIAYHRP